MRYSLTIASGKKLNIEWGNFTKKESFTKSSGIYSLQKISEFFKTAETYRGFKYVYGYPGKAPEDIFNTALANFKRDGRVLRYISETEFQIGEYVYSIEINSMEDLHRLISEFGRVIVDETSIVIYDDYLE